MNSARFEPIKKEFVDRAPQRDQYHKISSTKDHQRIFWLQAEDGWGKSWLLARLYLDTSDTNCLKALIDLGNIKAKDDQALLETVADELGGMVSEQMAEFIGAPRGNIDIRSEGDVNIKGDVAINKVVVNHQGGNDHISVEWRDSEGHDQRVRTLSRLFESGLKRLPESTQAILFLDHFEKATKPTHDWLVDHLFSGIRDGDYPNLIVVVASTQPFDFFDARQSRFAVFQQAIGGLPEDSVRQYWLEKRRLSESDLQTILKLLASKGNSPSALSAFADMIESSP